MNAYPCAPCGPAPFLVNIPGTPGAQGPQGPTGAPGAAGAPGANGISPSLGVIAAYGSGTAYSLTAIPARLSLGTTVPSITLANAGTYMLFAHARFDFNGATFAADQTITAKIHCTTNTVQDIPNTVKGIKLPIVTTVTYSGGIYDLAGVSYVATAGDVLELWGGISVVPSAGSMDTIEADIVAIQIAGGSGSQGGQFGVGSPQGVVTSPPGTTYLDTATGNFWVKQSGTGNVGWLSLITS